MQHRGALVAFLVLLPFLAASASAAQDTTSVLLRGQILDASTLRPVTGAFVGPAASRQGVLTDTLGLFAMRVPRADGYRLRVAQLGYHALEMAVTAASAESPFRLMLTPDPIQLQGLTVLSEKLADRRRGVYGVATIFEEKDLLRGDYTSLYEMTQRLIPSARLCPDTTDMGQRGDQLCFNDKGFTKKVSVCIDEHPAMGQGAEMDLLDPRGFYLVEAYPRLGQIRAYTRAFVAQVAANGQELAPLSFGCRGGMSGGPGPPRPGHAGPSP